MGSAEERRCLEEEGSRKTWSRCEVQNDPHQRRHARLRRSQTFTTMSCASFTSRSLRAARQAGQSARSNAYSRLDRRLLLSMSSQHACPSWNWPQRMETPRRLFSNSTRRFESSSALSRGSNTPAEAEAAEPRFQLTFTCTVENCSERSTHEFTKRAYEKGIVLVTCPKCKNRHLIADHIGWFKETEGTSGGQLKTVEDLMRAKGEKVTRGRLSVDGVVEYVE